VVHKQVCLETQCKPHSLKIYFFLNLFFIFLYLFDVLISKIFFSKIKKYYFNVLKKTL